MSTYDGEEKGIHSFAVETDRKKPLARPRRRQQSSIEVDLKEMGWEAMKWVDMVQGRENCLLLVKVLMNFTLYIPLIIIQFIKL